MNDIQELRTSRRSSMREGGLLRMSTSNVLGPQRNSTLEYLGSLQQEEIEANRASRNALPKSTSKFRKKKKLFFFPAKPIEI